MKRIKQLTCTPPRTNADNTPLSLGGTQADNKLPRAGKAGASPSPIRNRIAIKPLAPPQTENIFERQTN